MDGNNRSSEEIEYTAKQNSIESEEKWGENKGGMIEKVGEQRQVNSVGSDCIVATREGEESRASQSENVAAVQLSETDLQADFSESSHLLSEVPVEYSLQPLQSVEELKTVGLQRSESSQMLVIFFKLVLLIWDFMATQVLNSGRVHWQYTVTEISLARMFYHLIFLLPLTDLCENYA